ncbi:putative malate:quinone oxidoreductase [Neospora caninum Liverpool]|uniref:Malate:quinone oxidoreductase, putative n=1 Tax=Neospora caninum (strain Liverpool) TaxID=572307 RepID=F0VBN8_NEOCL|nr:putative malate:quinone oxidoreductase [Neospora caninum Liverpool]CBZ51022.1 putative malate:quinone oxidoreductase [Neospora caninum Liverpool]CEL68327.1 TPA: malate:quinone oxidoreductase, putative [Neospora caninum Liverpool]|eukprot:XP_003881055.1 putative malate:quinone oxidoreductase [Neospora caninum Liverpool]
MAAALRFLNSALTPSRSVFASGRRTQVGPLFFTENARLRGACSRRFSSAAGGPTAAAADARKPAAPASQRSDASVGAAVGTPASPSRETGYSFSTGRHAADVYDVFVVGGGVTGTALLYELCKFTDLKKIGLVERRPSFAVVASCPRNNSQTIHCGDIETNYTVEKAKIVKRQADMLRNYATKLPPAERDMVVQKMQKMALAVGDAECEFMEKRFHVFKNLFTRMQFIDKKKIADVEPRVGMKNSHSLRPDPTCAIFIPDEHSAVNYYHLAASFVDQAKKHANGKQVDIQTSTELLDLQHDGDTFSIKTSRGTERARFVVVSACGQSLLLAQRMGYGLNFSCLPMAGSFYFAPEMLNGKVYTCQDPRLPFAAVHGDPDLVAVGKTRFGPTALPLPMLERYNASSISDFLRVINPDMNLVKVYLDLLGTSHMRNYVMRNFLFEVPKLNTTLFANDVRKIVPSIMPEDLTYAKGYGGVRPQLIDKEQKKLLLGEGKINPGTGIIFNITPSPGGTTCLGNAEMDMRAICKRLGANIDEKLFRQTLLEGEYSVTH